LSILIRLVLALLFRFRWGLYVLAGIIVVGGLFAGFTSRQVVYQQAKQVSISHYLSGLSDNKAYIQTSDGSLYVLTETDFTPTLNSDALQSRTATLVYDPGETDSVDVDATNTSTHLQGTASTVVELISYGDSGADPKTFASSEFTENPHGFYMNNWGVGAGVMFAGILMAGITFLVRRRNRDKPSGYNAASTNGISITPASAMAAGYQQQAPFQQPTVYPQAPYPQAPAQQPAYPSNPYPQAAYPQQGQQAGGFIKPDRFRTLPGALPSNTSWSAPTQYGPNSYNPDPYNPNPYADNNNNGNNNNGNNWRQ
jgi:hypothetical protein